MFRPLAFAATLILALAASAQTPADLRTRDTAADLGQRGGKFLLAAQEAEGGWASQSGPGITCLVLRALIQEPTVGPQHPGVVRGVEFVKKFIRDDGGLYSAEGLLKNYETSVALSMFAALDQANAADAKTGPKPAADGSKPATDAPKAAGSASQPAASREIATLQKFLQDNQWDEGEGKSIDDPWYGGAGYGRGKRPDLSNTQMMLEALKDSGLSKDDPTYKKALVFIQRCQMLGESNDQPFAKGSTQGGFVYSAAGTGESKGDEIEINGRQELRCYGSMTYAGFKSMIYAGLKHDDSRVKAALNWIRQNWTLDHNPNMPEKRSQEGLYYYYHVFARALDAWGEDTIADKSGQPRNWRQELVEKLAKLQRPDGSWINEQDRWMEGVPALTTAYSMLALQAAYPQPGVAGTQPSAAPTNPAR
jgi:squalene-hopene/tetraprenyl-beta-curcumene cyclase